MRAVLTNLGSMGNTQPFFALAREMQQHGHKPLVALAPQFAGYAKRLNLEFAPVGCDLNYAELQRRDTLATLEGIPPLQILQRSLRQLESMLDRMFDEVLDCCRDADVLVGGHLQPVARVIHETTGIPFVSVHTNHFGGMQPREIREASCAVINPFRAKHGLFPIADPVHTDANSPQLALYAITRYLRLPPANWPPHWQVTGAFFLEEPDEPMEAGLEEFLAAGDPPVVITFSSMAHPDPVKMTNLLLDAVALTGRRAIIQRGWSGLAAGVRPSSDIFIAGFLQHSNLFPRAACVVHAGGSGTTTATLRAGAPAVVVPHWDDQPMWGELVRSVGCAGAVIPFERLTATGLACAIRHTLDEPSYRRTAQELAPKIRSECGVQTARMLIERHILRNGFLNDKAERDAQPAQRVSQRRIAIHNSLAKRPRQANGVQHGRTHRDSGFQ